MALTRLGTKAVENSLTNIVDQGTEGTKVATGTTAQRGSTVGQFRFNSTTGLAEYYDGSLFKSIDSPPTISSISPTTETDANANITITGSNFSSGATVKFVGNDGTQYTSPSVTVNSATQIIATTPSTALTVANEPYDIVVSNISGLSATLADALDAGGSPTWNTASGQVGGSIWEGDSVSVSLSATDPDGQTITYSETTSNLNPKGLTLGSNGIITGTAGSVTADTTVSFTARASDGVNTADRNFNLIIKNDYVDNLDILNDGSCLALYTFNNTTNDVSGNYNSTGMTSGSATFSSSIKAFGSHSWESGTSTGNVFSIPNPRNSYPLTISAWGYRSDWNTTVINNAEVVNGDISGQRLTMGLVDWSGNGQYEFTIMYGGTNHWTFAYPGGTLSSGWHHMVWSVVGNNNGSHAVYLDGTACSATNQGGGHGGSAGWRIGGNTGSPAGEYFKNGYLDHIRIFNKALSSSEVTSLYNLESARL